MASKHSLLFGILVLGQTIMAGPLLEGRQVTSATTGTGATATSTAQSNALIETTIGGTLTTITVAIPTGTGITTGTSTGTATTVTTDGSTSTGTSTDTAIPTQTAAACTNSIDQPICEPRENQTLYAGSSYYVSWSPSAFPNNASITVLLQSNDNSSTVAWSSNSISANRGFTVVTIDKAWLDNGRMVNYTLVWDYYSSDINGQKHSAYNVTIAPQQVTHLPAPPPTKLPNKESLIIALPIVLGFFFFVAIGLCIGMRGTRRIGLGNIMGRKKGYGTGKSRSQRMGIKKGAIRLEEREVLQSREAPRPSSWERSEYQDDADAITPVQDANAFAEWEIHHHPRFAGQSNHNGSELSLGSLADEVEPNTFRREIEQQRTGRL